jgi:hypothetical protein
MRAEFGEYEVESEEQREALNALMEAKVEEADVEETSPEDPPPSPPPPPPGYDGALSGVPSAQP